MINAFQKFWINYTKLHNLPVRSTVSKRQLEKKIQSISIRAPNSELGKICYTVKKDILAKYELVDLKLGTGLPDLSKESLDNSSSIVRKLETNFDSFAETPMETSSAKTSNGNSVEKSLRNDSTEPTVFSSEAAVKP